MGRGNVAAAEAAQITIPQVIYEKDDDIRLAHTGPAHGWFGQRTDRGDSSRHCLQEIASFHSIPRLSFLPIRHERRVKLRDDILHQLSRIFML